MSPERIIPTGVILITFIMLPLASLGAGAAVDLDRSVLPEVLSVGTETSENEDGPSPVAAESVPSVAITGQSHLEATRPNLPYLLAPMEQGGETGFVRVHQSGFVAASTIDGETLWERRQLDLKMNEMGAGPLNQGRSDVLIGPASSVMTGLPVGTYASPVALGDITADGIDDVLVAHNRILQHPWSNSSLSLLDGASGDVLWNELGGGFLTGVAYAQGVFVVANQTGEPETQYIQAERGGLSSLTGLRFVSTDDGIRPEIAWRIVPDAAEWGRWTGPVALGNGLIAAAFTPYSSEIIDGGPLRLIAIDPVSGDIVWEIEPSGEVNLLTYDHSRDELLFTEVATDLGSAVGAVFSILNDVDELPVTFGEEGWLPEEAFRIVAVGADDGTERVRSPYLVGLPQRLAVGDLTGNGAPDWALTARILGFGGIPMDSFILTLDGTTGLPFWQRSTTTLYTPEPVASLEPFLPPTPSEPLDAHGILIHEGIVVVGSDHLPQVGERKEFVHAFEGLSGTTLWSLHGTGAVSPSSLQPGWFEDRAVLFGVSHKGTHQVIDVEVGVQIAKKGTFSEVNTALAYDVTGDGRNELIVGTKSGGIFAFDAEALELGASGPNWMGGLVRDPVAIWQITLEGSITELQFADTDGDGSVRVVAVARHEVAVLDPTTGEVEVSIPYGGSFAWTATITDVDGDGTDDIIVPVNDIRAYKGSTGELLWAYEQPVDRGFMNTFSTTTVVNGVVVSQYSTTLSEGEETFRSTASVALITSTLARTGGGVLALDLKTGEEIWKDEIPVHEARPFLFRSVAPAPAWPGTTDAVAVLNLIGSEYEVVQIGSPVHLVVRILDAATGTDLIAPIEAPRWNGFLDNVQDGSLALISGGVIYTVRPDGLEQWTYPTTISFHEADFGAFGTGYVTGTHAIVGETRLTTGTPFSARIGIAADLTGNGIDEVIAFEHDWETKTYLFAKSSTVWARFHDALTRGVAIFEVGAPEE